MIVSSGLVHEPIPAHPDAIYQPQYRPIPLKLPPADSEFIGPRLMDVNPSLAAPHTASGDGFSLWWIFGPLIALLAAMIIAALIYGTKKKNDSKKQDEKEKINDPEKRKTNNKKTSEAKDKKQTEDHHAKQISVENVPLKSIKSDSMFKEQKKSTPMFSVPKGKIFN